MRIKNTTENTDNNNFETNSSSKFENLTNQARKASWGENFSKGTLSTTFENLFTIVDETAPENIKYVIEGASKISNHRGLCELIIKLFNEKTKNSTSEEKLKIALKTLPEEKVEQVIEETQIIFDSIFNEKNFLSLNAEITHIKQKNILFLNALKKNSSNMKLSDNTLKEIDDLFKKTLEENNQIKEKEKLLENENYNKIGLKAAKGESIGHFDSFYELEKLVKSNDGDPLYHIIQGAASHKYHTGQGNCMKILFTI